jgi:haloalkane dehalogenase
MHAVVDGPADGPVLLLVHGNPTASDLYSGVVARLRDRVRCVAVDLVGFGATPAPEGFGFTPLEQALALERFVLDRDLRDVTLVAQDWGGPIGFAVAGWHPERFAAFVVANTWAWPMRRPGAGTWSAWFRSPVGARAMQRFGARRWPEARLDAVKGLAAGVSGAAPFLAEVERGLDALRDRPALIAWGERDPVFGGAERRRFEQLFAEHRTVRLDAGHFVPDGAAADLADAIGAWHPALRVPATAGA